MRPLKDRPGSGKIARRALSHYFKGRPAPLCDSCILEGKCDKSGVYRERGVLGKPGWEVVGCSKYVDKKKYYTAFEN